MRDKKKTENEEWKRNAFNLSHTKKKREKNLTKMEGRKNGHKRKATVTVMSAQDESL